MHVRAADGSLPQTTLPTFGTMPVISVWSATRIRYVFDLPPRIYFPSCEAEALPLAPKVNRLSKFPRPSCLESSPPTKRWFITSFSLTGYHRLMPNCDRFPGKTPSSTFGSIFSSLTRFSRCRRKQLRASPPPMCMNFVTRTWSRRSSVSICWRAIQASPDDPAFPAVPSPVVGQGAPRAVLAFLHRGPVFQLWLLHLLFSLQPLLARLSLYRTITRLDRRLHGPGQHIGDDPCRPLCPALRPASHAGKRSA